MQGAKSVIHITFLDLSAVFQDFSLDAAPILAHNAFHRRAELPAPSSNEQNNPRVGMQQL